MRESITSSEYGALTAELVRLREAAGMTQRELAKSLGREQSFVWRIEKGERRLDMLEFYWVCDALGADASAVYAELCRRFHELTYATQEESGRPLRVAAEGHGEYTVKSPE